MASALPMIIDALLNQSGEVAYLPGKELSLEDQCWLAERIKHQESLPEAPRE